MPWTMDDTPRSLPDNGDIPFMYIGRKSSFPCGNFMAVRGKTALSNNGSWRRDASKRGPQPGYISAWRIDAVLDAHYSPLVQPSTSYRTNQTIASMMPKSTSKKAPVSFSSLPLQLIGAILSAGEFDLLQVIQLLRISRRIRRAALSTPAIWQNITTTVSAASRGQVIKALAHAVKLSGGLPLSLNLKLKQGLSVNGDIPYLAWAIFETGERWESLTFEYLWTDWPGDFLSEHLFQSLEFLTAIGAEGAPGKSPFTHLSTFKVAHTGVLGHFAPRLWGISTVFPELRHLSLSTEWGEVRGTDGFVRQFAGMRRSGRRRVPRNCLARKYSFEHRGMLL
ncbi:hypothetical protein CC2G_010956 [Coprinopsis cinerea AmutBmut pab1-1]|nr:hypothetical protein CC2G_010956 [Coprinopsis cinerea AmutBmut pab1-1]